MLSQTDKQLLKSYYSGSFDLSTSFNELAELFSEEDIGIKSAKT